MVFTTNHVMYQIKESVFVTYLYAGIFHPLSAPLRQQPVRLT